MEYAIVNLTVSHDLLATGYGFWVTPYNMKVVIGINAGSDATNRFIPGIFRFKVTVKSVSVQTHTHTHTH